MAVYDRWHRDPQDGDEPCKCGRGKNKLYPSAAHGRGVRWQVQYEEPGTGKRRKRNFALRDPAPGELADPEKHAAAFDALVQGQIVTRAYRDPNAGNVTLQAYAETWRRTRGHNEQTAGKLAARLRNHVYEDPASPGHSPRGALSIGQHPLALLAQRPTLVAAWVTSLKGPLPAERSRRQVADDVTSVLAAAVEDGIIGRNPMKAGVVAQPGRGGPKAQPFTAAEVDSIAGHLPGRLAVLPRLGAGTGMRLMELAALGVHDVQFLGRRPHVKVRRQLKRIGGRLVFAPLKNFKPHVVPLSPGTAAALTSHLERHPAAEVTLPWHEPGSKLHGTPCTVLLVLLGDDGGPLTRAAVSSAWRTAAARAAGAGRRDGSRHLSVTGWNPHRLRHTYVSAQLRAGVDVVRVAAATGDTVDVVVKTYAHLMRDDDGDAALRDAVDAFFGPGAPEVPSGASPGPFTQAEGV